MIPRCRIGKGVTGAVRYILGEGRHPETGELKKIGPDQISRVEWFTGFNFPYPVVSRDDAELARQLMEFAALNQASRTKRCEKDCVHLALGWHRAEQPSREEMEAAAREALKAIGMENAMALVSAHNDEDYSHVHIVASKINPDTGRAYDLRGNYLKLSRWAEQYERDHNNGIVCTRREEANRLRDAIEERDAAAVLALMTEQRSTFAARDLERTLFKQIKSEFARAQFAEQVLNHPDAVRLTDAENAAKTRYTSRQVLEAEEHVLRAASGLHCSQAHLVGEGFLKFILSGHGYDGISREQVDAVRHATGPEGLSVIDGQAGTGKTDYPVAAIRQIYEAKGYRVVGLAPTNNVALSLQQQGFTRARTIHSELFSLNNQLTQWDNRTVVIVDEAAMVDTRNMALLANYAHSAGAKLILVGDDRQLSSIERGGMFGALKDRYGAAVLSEVRRQHKIDERRASEMMAEGNFHNALEIYDAKHAIHWTRTQPEARAALVKMWAFDSANDPAKTRFVFAYTNDDVDTLNRAIRSIRKERGELEWEDHTLQTRHGRADFSAHDRIQFTGTDKAKGLINSQAGTVQSIDGSKITVVLDGRTKRTVEFDAAEFKDFRHGYAGTIYKAQGQTLDQTYLYHSEHWRSAPSYVALTRHRDKAELFVARNTAADLKQLARQMARVDDRRAASSFRRADIGEPVRPMTPRELMARLSDPALRRHFAQFDLARQQREESDKRQTPPIGPVERAARAANDPGFAATVSEEKTKSEKRYSGRYTARGDRAEDREKSRDRGGGGGRTR
jgi:Ti-type conjugative transfer relaxase TraA